MAVQTSVQLFPTRAISGQLGKGKFNVDILSARSGENTGDLQHGHLVYVSSWDDNGGPPEVKKLDSTNKANLFGIVVHENLQVASQTTTEIKTIKKGASISILLKGLVWTNQTGEQVAKGSDLIIDSADADIKGSASTGDVTYEGCKVWTPASEAGKLVLVQFNLPNGSVTAT